MYNIKKSIIAILSGCEKLAYLSLTGNSSCGLFEFMSVTINSNGDSQGWITNQALRGPKPPGVSDTAPNAFHMSVITLILFFFFKCQEIVGKRVIP